MPRKRHESIRKILSKNDVGETGSHMAGILIPKQPTILDFFPPLELHELNPRVEVVFMDSTGCSWPFNFLHYNNRFYGGTRNEYRLTGMTKYIKCHLLAEGDEIIFRKTKAGEYFIAHKKNSVTSKFEGEMGASSSRVLVGREKVSVKREVDPPAMSSGECCDESDVLVLGDSWRVVRLKK